MALVDPSKLADEFDLVVSIYEQADDGVSLVDMLRADWALFAPDLSKEAAEQLLGDILQDADRARARYRPLPRYQSGDALQQWEQLRNELMYENRYFPDTKFDLNSLAGLLPQLPALDLPEVWYRARIQDSSDMFQLADMGAPPKHKATHGRANPSGIPYLYLSESPITAISETRPHTGDKACVVKFNLPGDLKAVDLRSPRKLVSPFILEDEVQVGQMRIHIPLLERLGQELTRPVLPNAAPIDYVPTQYLCEFVKKSGYAGVIYRSSVGEGMNLALFNANLDPVELKRFNVDRVAVEATEAAP